MLENDDFYETEEIQQKEMFFLRTTSYSIDQTNDDLSKQLSRYKQMVKKLQIENNSLFQENEKYKLIVDELTQQKQKKDELYINNKQLLENKISSLQIENEQLRQEINNFNIIPPYSFPHDEYKEIETISTSQRGSISIPSDIDNHCPSINHSECASSPDIVVKKYKHSLKITPQNMDMELLGTEAGNGSNSIGPETNYVENTDGENETMLVDKDGDNGIMVQLIQFGYDEEEILNAMESVNDKCDINEVLAQIIQKGDAIDFAYQEIVEQEMNEKIEEIKRLKEKNEAYKKRINKLQGKIKELRKQNQKLKILNSAKKDNKENGGCSGVSWKSWKLW